MSASATIGVSILGSTGSIGVSTLDVITRHPDRYRVIALTASTQADRMLAQCRQYRPRVAVMRDVEAARRLRDALRAEGLHTEVLEGEAGLLEAARHPDAQVVMAAIVGAAGLLPTLAAVRAGRRVLLANKEPLVMSGHILMAEARRSGAVLLPIDSEHNAVFQCLPNDYRAGEPVRGVRRILLTCSGGPFRALSVEQMASVTPEQACAHPNWSMGRKISVDSATLMNKGLEVIEACRLFAAHPDQVEVVIHPQSVIHSMVDYADGSVLAQLGNPDMRTPIAHALAWPERIDSGVKPLDLFQVAHLDFSAPDRARFPCLDLAYRAVRAGGTTPAILNAANEWAVNAFLERRIGFLDIPRVIAGVLDSVTSHPETEIDAILDDDRAARLAAGHIAHPQSPSARSSHA